MAPSRLDDPANGKVSKAIFKYYELTLIFMFVAGFFYYWSRPVTFDHDITRRYVENKLRESLKLEKGTGCKIPELDPFSIDVFDPDEDVETIDCSVNGRDWVKCYHSECIIIDEIRKNVVDISCSFSDILYKNDSLYEIGPETSIVGDGIYILRESDHVKVSCTGINSTTGSRVKWLGYTLGLRSVEPMKAPRGRERSYNVLILAFDSTPKNGFIRRMPLSWKVLTEELGATVMNGFNVLGDGTTATLFPLLTGKSEFELPDARKRLHKTKTLDSFPFIFYKLKEDGYRTAYFEDMPEIGSFQYRFNGFSQQPADHYLRAFFLEENSHHNFLQRVFYGRKYTDYCVGDTEQFNLMLNITQQFMELGGKRFAFTFIADITHDNFDLIQVADRDTADFLRYFKRYADDTLLVVMGDHGPRYSKARETVQGKLEERLPLLAILLPKSFVRERPHSAAALKANHRALTTPHDLHATILDVIGMTRHGNTYKVRGAEMPRALTLLRPIPETRSCSEAGVEAHWCACAAWELVPSKDPTHAAAAEALLNFVNDAVRNLSRLCEERWLTATGPVWRLRARRAVLQFAGSVDPDGYRPRFAKGTPQDHEILQVQIVVGPARGVFEASMRHEFETGEFLIDIKDVSRISPYNNEPDCISKTHPDLNPFCYCKEL